MPEAPPYRVLPNPLQRLAACATVVTGPSVSVGRTVPASEYVMPSHLSADRPAAQPPERGTVDALISQTRRLRGDVDAVRRDAPRRRGRTRRAAGSARCATWPCINSTTSATHLGQLQGRPAARAAEPARPRSRAPGAPPPAPRRGSLLSRVGSAEWNLLTDEVSWSEELYQILGRDPAARPALPRRTAVPGARRGPADADRDGHGLSGRRQAHRRRVPHRAARRRGSAPCT